MVLTGASGEELRASGWGSQYWHRHEVTANRSKRDLQLQKPFEGVHQRRGIDLGRYASRLW